MKKLPPIFLFLLAGLVYAGCSEDYSTQASTDLDTVAAQGEELVANKRGDKPGGGTPGGDTPDAFLVSVSTVDGTVDGVLWTTKGPQTLINKAHKNWLHVYDSGGTGTRGTPDYEFAAFTATLDFAPAGVCVGNGNLSDYQALGEKLYVFDFQVSYNIEAEPQEFSIFKFRWKVGNFAFTAKTSVPSLDYTDSPYLVFIGNSDINDPTDVRKFQISGGSVVFEKSAGKKTIETLECPNDQVFEVTVSPI